MREFLLELYLKYGEREFSYRADGYWWDALISAYLCNPQHSWFSDVGFKLTPKALTLIKNDS